MPTGFVLDADGRTVSLANVTFWQDGKAILPSWNKPVVTNIFTFYNDIWPTGSYSYFAIPPGRYTVIADKNGYSGSIDVQVTNETIDTTPGAYRNRSLANVTLNGYHSGFTMEQLALTGGISGPICDTYSNKVYYVVVSLWQNGKMVDSPQNPQRTSDMNVSDTGTYLFEHLAPGRYVLTGEKLQVDDIVYNGSTDVVVGDIMVTPDFIITGNLASPPTLTPTTMPTFVPTVENEQFPSSTPVPSPSPGIVEIVTLGIAVVLFNSSIHRR